MKMFKKVVSVAMCIVMILGMANVSFAGENGLGKPIELGSYMGIESEYIGNINNHNFKIILDEMIQNRVDTYVASEEDLKIAYDILRIYDINQKETTKAIDKNAYDDNKRKLRTGNLIELTLDYDEGISDSMIIKCLQLAKKSKKEATKNFSSYQDSGQHFIWNFKMTDRYDKKKARIIANNHEWGIAMIDPMLNHFHRAYEKHIDEGYSEERASNKALADTISYIPIFKYQSVLICQSSYSVFSNFFTDESIMDFWNNCYGRAYCEKGYTDAIEAFRYAAFTAGDIVLDGTNYLPENLTLSQKKLVWSWDWYSY